jgi:hypothetical protein
VEATRENPGTAIAPGDGRKEGRWIRWRPSGKYDVRAFGAHPEQEDNADAMQACFDAAATKGGTVRIPPGVYRVSRPLVMDPHVTVEGEGRKSVIKKTSRELGPSLRRAHPNQDVKDEYEVDCILAVDRPNTDLKFSHKVKIDGVALQGLAGQTGKSEDRNAYGLYAPRLHRSQINDVTISHVQTGFHFKEIIVSQISNCRASWVETGFEIPDLDTGGGTSLTLTSCYASKVDGWGYYLRGLSYSTLVGCACDHANQEKTGGGYFLGGCHGITLSSSGCEATVAPVLKIKHSEVVVNGLKTFGIQGRDSKSAYIEVKSSTMQLAGCRLQALRNSGQTRNGRYEQGADVTYINGERPSGGAPALVDESSSLLCIGLRAADSSEGTKPDASIRSGTIGFEEYETVLSPDGADVKGDTVLRERQPPIGELVDASEGVASRRVEKVDDGGNTATINNNFATLSHQLERIREVLGQNGHGLTDDYPNSGNE